MVVTMGSKGGFPWAIAGEGTKPLLADLISIDTVILSLALAGSVFILADISRSLCSSSVSVGGFESISTALVSSLAEPCLRHSSYDGGGLVWSTSCLLWEKLSTPGSGLNTYSEGESCVPPGLHQEESLTF